MVALTGDMLVWLACVLALPLMTAPLAILWSGESRASAVLTWLGITFAIVTAGAVFSHLAVDLPRFTAMGALAASAVLMGLVVVALSLGAGLRRTVFALAGAFAGAVRGAGRAVMWLLIIMAIVQFMIVILRYVFGINFIFMQESVTYMHGAVFLLAAGYALLTDDHVRVDIFYRSAPAHRKAAIDLAGIYLFLFPFCLTLLWASTPYVANAWAVFEGSTEQSGIQGVFLLKSLIVVFAVLLAMAGFVRAVDATKTLRPSLDGRLHG